MGSDMGGLRAVGLRAVPLRPLGAYRRPLGLGPGHVRGTSHVGACARRVDGRCRVGSLRDGRRTGIRMGAAWMGRAVSPLWGRCSHGLLDRSNPYRGHVRVAAEQPAPSSVSQLEFTERLTAVSGSRSPARQTRCSRTSCRIHSTSGTSPGACRARRRALPTRPPRVCGPASAPPPASRSSRRTHARAAAANGNLHSLDRAADAALPGGVQSTCRRGAPAQAMPSQPRSARRSYAHRPRSRSRMRNRVTGRQRSDAAPGAAGRRTDDALAAGAAGRAPQAQPPQSIAGSAAATTSPPPHSIRVSRSSFATGGQPAACRAAPVPNGAATAPQARPTGATMRTGVDRSRAYAAGRTAAAAAHASAGPLIRRKTRSNAPPPFATMLCQSGASGGRAPPLQRDAITSVLRATCPVCDVTRDQCQSAPSRRLPRSPFV